VDNKPGIENEVTAELNPAALGKASKAEPIHHDPDWGGQFAPHGIRHNPEPERGVSEGGAIAGW